MYSYLRLHTFLSSGWELKWVKLSKNGTCWTGGERGGGEGVCKSPQLQTHSIIITDENGKPKWPGWSGQSVQRSLLTAPRKLFFQSIQTKSTSTTSVTTHLCYESIDEHSLWLAKAIDSKYGLYVMGRIPRNIEHDNSVSSHQIDTQSTRLGRDQEQTRTDRKYKGINSTSKAMKLK